MVRGQNGQVIAIGGLMRQSSTDDENRVPGAGSIPLVGNLFKSKNKVNQKRELVVLIKPTIVESGANWNQDLLDTGRRIEQLAPNGRGR
jgi:MSHA biogenesis protein MshL